MTSKRLIILSDLWGNTNADWENKCVEYFKSMFEVTYYDCCKLGNINTENYTQDYLHQQFVNGGIDIAVENLLQLEKQKVTVLAFSIGGTIAWKAALKGLKVNQLILLSATRLRYEILKPCGKIQLYFGENDDYKPTQQWFESMNLTPIFIKKQEHEFYQNDLMWQMFL